MRGRQRSSGYPTHGGTGAAPRRKGHCRKLAPELVEKIENILARLESAGSVEDMNLPGFRLHSLEGDRQGFWSVTVRTNWRVIVRFESGTAFDAELTDYH